jgi:hypothetical protein
MRAPSPNLVWVIESVEVDKTFKTGGGGATDSNSTE